ncbi:hypothetical protein [Nonomuraea recticatena]|uniref:hypothetical protein n=1 Tax=Nonomuraea recticatena TaxID=46178 RepID=UPI00361CFC02
MAAWLWDVEEEDALPPWQGDPQGIRAAAEAQRGLPEGLLPLDRFQVITTVLGATDSLRYQLAPASVAATGRRLIAGLVDALPAQPTVYAPAKRLGRGAQEISAGGTPRHPTNLSLVEGHRAVEGHPVGQAVGCPQVGRSRRGCGGG